VTPVLLVAGYLGAGKTTLINHLLRHAQGQRIAVLVNDFGSVNIDAALIEADDGEVLSLSGGCLCCSYGADLVGSLQSVLKRSPAPQLVLIETSGVAMPAAAARTARLVPGITLGGTVVLVDASRALALQADRYVGDVVQQQWREADVLLVNQVDRVDESTLTRVRASLQAIAPHALQLELVQARVTLEALLALATAPTTPQRVTHSGNAPFVTCSLAVPRHITQEALQTWLAQHAPSLQRAKGLWRDRHGQGWLLQAAGSRCEVSAFDAAPLAGTLVLIGHSDDFDAKRVAQSFADFMATMAQPH
jgi:G3E family GTPase